MFRKIWTWVVAAVLKKYIQPEEVKPRRYPEPGPDVDERVVKDRYAERNSDPTTTAINEKIMEAVANLKFSAKRKW